VGCFVPLLVCFCLAVNAAEMKADEEGMSNTPARGGVPWGEKGGADEQEEKARRGASLTEWETFLSACLRYSVVGGLSSAREIKEDVGRDNTNQREERRKGGCQNNKKNRYDGGGAGADTTKLEIRTRGRRAGGDYRCVFLGRDIMPCINHHQGDDRSTVFYQNLARFFVIILCYALVGLLFLFLSAERSVHREDAKTTTKKKNRPKHKRWQRMYGGATCTNILGGYFFLIGYTW